MESFLSPEEKRELQLDELRALRELDRVCRLHGLSYFITAGTLLGAVRHGGFIPWDDDIDVAMTRKDYKKLSKIAKTALSPGFFWQDGRTDKHYPFAFAKIRIDGTEVCEPLLVGVQMHKGRYIDIFPLDRCPTSPRPARLMFKLHELLSCARVAKDSNGFVCEYKKRSARAAFSLLRLLPRGALSWLRRATVAVFGFFSSGRTIATVSGSHGYPRESYDAEWFEKSTALSFEGERYPAPEGYRELLTRMYGDYMTPPPEDEQAGHFRRE